MARDVKSFCDFDRNADGRGFYTVRTVYLDSSDWGCFFEKNAGTCERHKLRVRAYPGRAGNISSVKFEIKHRNAQLISKDVGAVGLVDYKRLEPLLRSHRMIPPDFLRSIGRDAPNAGTTECRDALRRFFAVKLLHSRIPVLCLQYRRQAMRVRANRAIRITLDDQLVSRPTRNLLAPMTGAHPVLNSQHCIFEIKTPGSIPYWLHTIIRKYRLHVQSVSKYVLAAAAGPFGLDTAL